MFTSPLSALSKTAKHARIEVRTEPDFNPFTSWTTGEQSTYQIFGGFDYGVNLGGTLLRIGNDIYRESFFDFFLLHKRTSASLNATGFTGMGVQCRYQLNDEPVGNSALYEWYSFSLGICYYVTGRD